MGTEFNRESFINELESARSLAGEAARLGETLGKGNYKRLYFVGCGGPNRVMSIMDYWVKRVATTLDVRSYFPAEFVHQNPAALDENTLIILGSHSGTTPETVEAAKFLLDKPCTTIAITQAEDSPLAQNAEYKLLYGKSAGGGYSRFILGLALVSGFVKEIEPGWTLHDKIMSSLAALPEALADASDQNDERAKADAETYEDDRIMYIIGSGPVHSTAYLIGVCILLEMQWMHVQPVVGAEFFHGPFEIVDETIPLIILLGEDPSRPEAERVLRFSEKYGERLMIYDSKDYAMTGIDPEVRAIVAPMILEAALYRFAEHLSVLHDHPLATRRYMWKVEY